MFPFPFLLYLFIALLHQTMNISYCLSILLIHDKAKKRLSLAFQNHLLLKLRRVKLEKLQSFYSLFINNYGVSVRLQICVRYFRKAYLILCREKIRFSDWSWTFLLKSNERKKKIEETFYNL